MKKPHLSKRLLFLAALSVFLASPLPGDVLITTDGKRIETEGKWEVKGRMVRFHSTGGTLQSMRLSEIDLEASEKATEEAARSAAPPPKAEPQAKHPERPPSLPVRAKSEVEKPTVVIDHEHLSGGKRPGIGELILTKNRKRREAHGWDAKQEDAYQDLKKILKEFPELDRYPKRPYDLAQMAKPIKEMSDRVHELIPSDQEGNEDLIRFLVGVMLDLSNLVNNQQRAGWEEDSLEDLDRYWQEIRPH